VKYLSMVALTMACAMAAPAEAEVAKCTLEIKGKAYISGDCDYDTLSRSDGSFKIMALDAKYFAYVYVEGTGKASAHWNEEAGANHAHTPLGQMRLATDGCWINDTTRICVSPEAASAVTGRIPYGKWNCGNVMGFSLDGSTYTVNGKRVAVANVEQIAEDAYGVTLVDAYRFALFDVGPESLTWHSPESGDTFDCKRE